MTPSHADYDAIANGAALIDLGAWARLRFRGPDARAFLNGLLTNDVAKLAPHQGFPVCLLTPKGRAQAEFLLYDAGDSLLALARPESAANLKAVLGRMIMLSETKMEDLSSSTSLALLAGPRASEVIEKAFGARPPGAFGQLALPKAELFSYPRFHEKAVFALSADDLSEELARAGAAPAGEAAFETWRIERGIPAYGRELDEETIPLEARLEEAISYTKGCYMGQETISRIHHLGRVNRLLTALKVQGEPPKAGSPVAQDGKPVGKVTSACASPRFGGALALAMVRLESAKAGTRLSVEGRPAQVLSLEAWAH